MSDKENGPSPWELKEYKRKRLKLEEIHQKNQKVLKDLKDGTLRQNKHKGIYND